MRIRPLVFGFMCLVIMASCSGKTVSTEQELKNYILDDSNGLYKSISKGDVKIEVSYRPADLIWGPELKELHREEDRNALRQNYNSLHYFVLHFSKNGHEIESAIVSDPAKFNEVISYLSFGIMRDLAMVQEQDTIPASDVIYTRTFGGATGTSILAVFNGKLKQSGNLRICFVDTKLGTGSTEFNFKISDIKNTPTLTMN